MEPKVSVLIPTYNRAEFLDGTLTSVFKQTLPPHEVLLIDDGSTDHTQAVVSDFIARNPSFEKRLRYQFQENAGKSVALNSALEQLTGEWLAYNDSDDEWLPEKLAEQFETIQKHPDCGVCFSDCVHSGNSGPYRTEFQDVGFELPQPTGKLPDSLSTACELASGIRMQTLLIHNKVQTKAGPFNPSYRVAQDTDLLFRLALHSNFCYVRRPLVKLDRTPNVTNRLTETSGMNSIVRKSNHEKMLRHWLTLIDDNRPEIKRRLKTQIRDACSMQANLFIKQGNKSSAKAAIERGLDDQFDIRLFLKLCKLAVL